MTVFRRGPVYAYDFTRAGRRYTRSSFPSQQTAADAQAIAIARLTDSRLHAEYGLRPRRQHVPSVRAWIEKEWLPSRKGSLGTQTYAQYASHGRKLAGFFGSVRISDVRRRDVEAYRDARAGSGVSSNQVRIDCTMLRRCLRAAQRAGYLATDPSAGLELPRGVRGPDRILTAAEEVRLLAAFRVPRIRDLVALALLTGLRRAELTGLTWGSVDLAGARLTVHREKTASVSILPLIPAAVALLESQAPGASTAPVFPGPAGPYHEHAITAAFRRAVVRSGIPPIRLNDLRHTVAVRLLRAGVDLPTVGMILGHRPPYHTTLRYVAHTSHARASAALHSLHIPQQAEDGKTATPLITAG